MRKVIYAMSISLDGFIEAPGGDLSWGVPDEELHKHFNDLEKGIDLHLYGRGLYETMASYWPTAEEDPSLPEVEKEYARIWNAIPIVVFSRTLQQVGKNARLVKENIAAEVNALKALPGKSMNVGGAGLASTFMQLGLIDEFRIYIRPVILGSGKPMFQSLRERINLRHVETHTFGSGAVMIRYERVEV